VAIHQKSNGSRYIYIYILIIGASICGLMIIRIFIILRSVYTLYRTIFKNADNQATTKSKTKSAKKNYAILRFIPTSHSLHRCFTGTS